MARSSGHIAVDDQEFYQLADKDGVTDIHLFNEKLREREYYYNYHRPHGALGGQTPTSDWWRKKGRDCRRSLRTLQLFAVSSSRSLPWIRTLWRGL